MRCHRSACRRDIAGLDVFTHIETGETYCAMCARRINFACSDIRPKGLVFDAAGEAPGLVRPDDGVQTDR